MVVPIFLGKIQDATMRCLFLCQQTMIISMLGVVCGVILIIPLTGGALLSLGNIQMLKAVIKVCADGSCVVRSVWTKSAEAESSHALLIQAERHAPNDLRTQIGLGSASLLLGDYMAAVRYLGSAFNRRQDDPIVIGRTLAAAERAGDRGLFLAVYASEKVPEQYRQEFRPVAAAYYVDLAEQAVIYSDREKYLSHALQSWPGNLCALSAKGLFAIDDSEDEERIRTTNEFIKNRNFDGAYSAVSSYQECLLKRLPELAESRPALLFDIADILGRWLWQDGAPDMTDVFTRLAAAAPTTVNLQKALGDAFLAKGDWQSAQKIYQKAAQTVEQLDDKRILIELAELLPRLAPLLPDKVSYIAAATPGSLDGFWGTYGHLYKTEPHNPATAEALQLLQSQLRTMFPPTKQRIPLKPGWDLGGWYVDSRQLELSRRVSLWLLLKPVLDSMSKPGPDWIELDGYWVARVDGMIVIPDAGFEIHSGSGTWLPWPYTPLAGIMSNTTVSADVRNDTPTQTVEIASLSPEQGGAIISSPQPVQPDHLYMFVPWLRAEQSAAPGYGAVAACRWLNADGVEVGERRFLSGYSHMYWSDHIHLHYVPSNAHWCQLILMSNDPANRIWYDNLLLIDISSVLETE